MNDVSDLNRGIVKLLGDSLLTQAHELDKKEGSHFNSQLCKKFFLRLLDFATPENLHYIIFRLYTMESFIYKNLNDMLRR